MSVPSAHLTWARTMSADKEHVYFVNFVRRFDLFDSETATRDFLALLDSPNIRTQRREKLKHAFEDFQKHHQKKFWADRALQLNTKVIIRQAGAIVQDAGVMQAKVACEQFFSSPGDSSLNQDLLDNSEYESEDSGVEERASIHKAGQKHPRDTWGGLVGAPPKTPRKTSPSPTLVPTENIDSPPMVQSGAYLPNRFLDDEADLLEEEDDEQFDAANEDENNGQDFLLPDKVEKEFSFVGHLDGLDLAPRFQPFFAEVKKKAVYIEDTDEVLGRSGVIFLKNEGSAFQQKHFGTAALAQIRQKMLPYWHTADVTASRNKARAWLDLINDKKYHRSEILLDMAKSPPSDSIDIKLWLFLMGAVSKFPVKDTTKLYSESTGLSSYVLPLCQVFMADPENNVFFNFVDKTTVSGKSRSGTKSKREPDLVLELKDQSNKTVCELGVGEGTSHAHKNYKRKNAKDLARIGLGLKDALDLIQDKYGVDDATLVGYQVIAQTMSIYLMRRCGDGSNMYIMIHIDDVLIPDSLKDLMTIGTEYNLWFELALTVRNGIKPVLVASAKGKVSAAHLPVKSRILTTSTPDLNKLLKRL